MDILSIVPIAALIVSAISLFISIRINVKFDKKIKAQELILNEYQLQKNKNAEEDDKKAYFQVELIKSSESNRIIKVTNTGKSKAFNVEFFIPENPTAYYFNNEKNQYPTVIDPENNIQIKLMLNTDYPSTIQIELKWQDEFNKLNELIKEIQLL